MLLEDERGRWHTWCADTDHRDPELWSHSCWPRSPPASSCRWGTRPPASAPRPGAHVWDTALLRRDQRESWTCAGKTETTRFGLSPSQHLIWWEFKLVIKYILTLHILLIVLRKEYWNLPYGILLYKISLFYSSSSVFVMLASQILCLQWTGTL